MRARRGGGGSAEFPVVLHEKPGCACTLADLQRPPRMERYFSPQLSSLHDLCRQVVETHVAPMAAQVDAQCLWPAHSMKALAEAGLMGLQAPASVGGHGQGLLGLTAMTELIARACPSSALCFGMHCVGTAVIAAKATEHHRERYLRPIAEGRHITTLSLSETGSGTHFYLPATRLAEQGDWFVVDGEKQFVTNGGHADSYVLSVAPAAGESQGAAGEFERGPHRGRLLRDGDFALEVTIFETGVPPGVPTVCLSR